MPSVEWGPRSRPSTTRRMRIEAVPDGARSDGRDARGARRRRAASLEFAVGTGRVALALSARGVEVHGIELVAPHARPAASQAECRCGARGARRHDDDARCPASSPLVYLVANTIMNVTTQDEQIAVFENAHRISSPADASCSSSSCRSSADVLAERASGWVFTIDARPRRHRDVRRHGRDRSPGRITGSRPTATSSATPRPIATCGRPSSTSWRGSRASGCVTGGPTGIATPSPRTARHRSSCSRRSASIEQRLEPVEGFVGDLELALHAPVGGVVHELDDRGQAHRSSNSGAADRPRGSRR